jgi:hypothetical protein
VERTTRWCRVLVLDDGGRELVDATFEGRTVPLEAVDVVSVLALHARRRGGSVRVLWADPALASLLALAGLPLEVRGEPEEREQPLGLEQRQEERHLGDPPV